MNVIPRFFNNFTFPLFSIKNSIDLTFPRKSWKDFLTIYWHGVKNETVDKSEYGSFLKNIPITDSSKLIQSLSSDLAALSKKKKNIFTAESRDQFNEEIYQGLLKIRHAKNLFKSKNFLDQLAVIEIQFQKLSPHIPVIDDLIEAFSKSALKATLQETICSLCLKNSFSEVDLQRDCSLFHCSKTDMKMIYVKRMLKAKNTGFTLSTVSAIETIWQELNLKNKTESEERSIGKHKVFFIPGKKKGEIVVLEKFIDKGSFKIAFLATSFLKTHSIQDRGTLAVLRPKPKVKKQPTKSSKTAEPIQAKNFLVKSSSSTSESSGSSLDYENEVHLCKKTANLEGVWPTHTVTKINGEFAIIQPAAGYHTILKNGNKVNAINLKEMMTYLRQNQLSISDQVIMLRMIEDFIKGVQNLHSIGIIHRDLKPDNVLCSRNGRGGVTDLGLACYNKIYNRNGVIVNNPDKRSICGTNYYIAPEIAVWSRDAALWKEICTEADVWSIGMTLWQLLSGKKIYEHPAIQIHKKSAHNLVGKLLDKDQSDILKNYFKRFPEPKNKNGILYLIWQSTQADPYQRIDIHTLVSKYHQWAYDVSNKLKSGKLNSIQEAFKAEILFEGGPKLQSDDFFVSMYHTLRRNFRLFYDKGSSSG